MFSNKLLELIKNRRSIRKWTEQQVEEEKLEKILISGAYAPTAANTQKVKFYVIRDAEIVRKVAPCTSPWFRKIFPNRIIVVLFDLNKPHPLNINVNEVHFGWSRFIWQDTAAATMSMLLMSEALGLSACWVSISPPEICDLAQKVKDILKIPNGYIITGFVFLGYGNEKVDINTAIHQKVLVKRDVESTILKTFK